MKKRILFASFFISILAIVSLFTLAKEILSEDTVYEAGTAVESDQCAPVNLANEQVITAEKDTQEKIQGVIREISLLTDKNDEAELQKQIEKIKQDAEVARFTAELKKAEDKGDIDTALEIKRHLDSLENIEKPAIGIPDEQPAPATETIE